MTTTKIKDFSSLIARADLRRYEAESATAWNHTFYSKNLIIIGDVDPGGPMYHEKNKPVICISPTFQIFRNLLEQSDLPLPDHQAILYSSKVLSSAIDCFEIIPFIKLLVAWWLPDDAVHFQVPANEDEALTASISESIRDRKNKFNGQDPVRGRVDYLLHQTLFGQIWEQDCQRPKDRNVAYTQKRERFHAHKEKGEAASVQLQGVKLLAAEACILSRAIQDFSTRQILIISGSSILVSCEAKLPINSKEDHEARKEWSLGPAEELEDDEIKAHDESDRNLWGKAAMKAREELQLMRAAGIREMAKREDIRMEGSEQGTAFCWTSCPRRDERKEAHT